MADHNKNSESGKKPIDPKKNSDPKKDKPKGGVTINPKRK